jgi:hypothetical protein
LEEELKSGRGTLKVIGLALTQNLHKSLVDGLEKKKTLSEEFLFKG